MKVLSVLETALYVDDLAVAKTFYRLVLGLQVFAEEIPRHVFLRCGHGMLLLFNAEETLKGGRNEIPADLDFAERKREVLIEAINNAILAAAREAVGPARGLRVEIDPKSGDIKVYARFTVVEKVENKPDEIGFDLARKFKRDVQLGEDLEVPVTPRGFARIAAQTAKQAMMERIRQAEKEMTKDTNVTAPHGAYGPQHVCFRVPHADLDRWMDHLRLHGVSIELDHHWPRGGRSLYFRDPAGNSLELASPIIWGMPEE
jgi:catechol 2,3-dioxygenase-like lactoylglutathione lyase family enzyme